MAASEPLSKFNSITSDSFEYKPSRVTALFLINFDVRRGYQLVWSKQAKGRPPIDLGGLDYKVLPSGIQEHKTSTVFISHACDNTVYYGLGRFRQRIVGADHESSQISRDDVKMYSLGVLCESTPNPMWKSNEFINNGWEYINKLDDGLEKFLDGNDYDNFTIFDEVFDNVTNTHLKVGKPNININNHLLSKLPLMFQSLGPLVFSLFKQCLLRKKVLIFHQNHSKIDNFSLGAFTYLLSLLSMIPNDIKIHSDALTYSQPLYNVGLNDLESSLLEFPATIATTNDDILMYQKNLYDYAVFLPNEEYGNSYILKSDTLVNSMKSPLDFLNHRVKATLKDYHKFKLIYKQLLTRTRSHTTNASTDDLASIKTSNSNVSSRGWGFNSQKDETYLEAEPMWWMDSATCPISWREYVWSAFSWFASAGRVGEDSTTLENNDDHPSRPINNDESSLNDEDSRRKLIQLVEIVGRFHMLTKKWFYLMNEIIREELDEQTQAGASTFTQSDSNGPLLMNMDEDSKISIELTYQDIIDMELDPYSEQDLQFVKDFVLLYWGSVVKNVEIGIGLSGICC